MQFALIPNFALPIATFSVKAMTPAFDVLYANRPVDAIAASLFSHDRQCVLTGKKHAGEVYIDDLVPIFLTQAGDTRVAAANANIIVQNVDSTVISDAASHHIDTVLFRGDIHAEY